MKRRELLSAGAAAVAVAAVMRPDRVAQAALPASSRLAPRLLSWHPGEAVADFQRVRAGWMPRCASVRGACADDFADELRDACASCDEQGMLRVRVLGLANADQAQPFALRAHYDENAVHDLWSAWRGPAGLATSAPVTVRWQDTHGEGLRLSLHGRERELGELRLPARRGAYVLLLDARASDERTLALRPTRVGEPYARALSYRRSGRAYTKPYLLLSVERAV